MPPLLFWHAWWPLKGYRKIGAILFIVSVGGAAACTETDVPAEWAPGQSRSDRALECACRVVVCLFVDLLLTRCLLLPLLTVASTIDCVVT